MSFERNCKNGNIVKFPLPQVLRYFSTLSFSCSGCQICCLYILTLSLSLESPIPVSPIYSFLHVGQMTTQMRFLLSHVIFVFKKNCLPTFLNVYEISSKSCWQHRHLLSEHLNTPAVLFVNKKFVQILFRFGGCRFA